MVPNSTDTEPQLLPLDAPERRRLPPLLRRAWYGLNQAFRRRIAHTEVTPDQFTVLRTLLEGDPHGMTQSQVTRVMTSDPNTVASLLERMERYRGVKLRWPPAYFASCSPLSPRHL